HDASLLGVNTVLEDNPSLTTRIAGGRNPLRIILDTKLRTPIDANIVTDNKARTWIFVGKDVSKEDMGKFSNPRVRIIQMDDSEIKIKKVLEKLGEEKISSVFVEGGATVNGSFLKAGFINELIMYIAPII